MTRTAPSNSDDIADIRDIIARFEYLDALREDTESNSDETDTMDEDDTTELSVLKELLDDLTGYGGDHQWQGAWFPVTLIRDSYFEDYARDLADDIHGKEMRDSHWPFTHIDWEAAAHALQQDYSSVEWDGVTYWYR